MYHQWKNGRFALLKKLFNFQVEFHRYQSNFKDHIIPMMLNFPAHSRKKEKLLNFLIKSVILSLTNSIIKLQIYLT